MFHRPLTFEQRSPELRWDVLGASSSDIDPETCQLSRKLGWDPDLVWRKGQTKWIFAPGDGSADATIDLDTGG